jgi:threonine synthase
VEIDSLIVCTNCHNPYPHDEVPFRCPICGGSFDIPSFNTFNSTEIDRTAPGIWCYRHTFELEEQDPVISLGEGKTPLVWVNAFGRSVALKLEYLNPTGSYKDRGSAVLVSFLKGRKVSQVIEDSSGNAGASLAAYAARAGVKSKVFVPATASGPKRRQIEAYGAELVPVAGSRSDVAHAVELAAEGGQVYASHAYLPHVLTGYATLAYELYEGLGQAPGTILIPVGQGNLLLAVGRGFQRLKAAGLINRMPVLVGVQARACAPLWAVFHYGIAGMSWVAEGETLAEGVRVKNPVRGDAFLSFMKENSGLMVAVDENEIIDGRIALAHQGFYVEPTSAIVWNALQQIIEEVSEPIVVVLTGSGLKVN